MSGNNTIVIKNYTFCGLMTDLGLTNERMKPIYDTLRNVFLQEKLAVLGFCCYLRRQEKPLRAFEKESKHGKK